MAIFKNGIIIVLLAVTLCILETGNVVKLSSLLSPLRSGEQHISREKRDEPLGEYEYEVSIELNVPSVETVDYLRSLLDNSSLSLSLGPTVNLTDIDITTVCYSNGSNFQCRCEEDFFWPYDNCETYQACDEIVDDTCTCINSIPPEGQYCLPKTGTTRFSTFSSTTTSLSSSTTTTAGLGSSTTLITATTGIQTTVIMPPFVHEYLISIELNTTDMSVIHLLRNILRNTSYPIYNNSYSKFSTINITTVCSPSSDGFQCICEDQYRWSCNQCFLHGSCDNITNDTCGCINAIPSDGQYCQSVDLQNFTACPVTTSPTTSPVFDHEYLISIEVSTTNMSVINLLRNILRNTSYPIYINRYSEISDINITTVCSPSSNGFQCTCEGLFRWSCDQCFLHGSCDNITNDTCGCINAIPSGGQYCQSVDQYNFTACPVPTMSPTTTSLPFHHEYLVSIELNTTDMSAINLLRSILRNTSYPIDINNYSKVSDINITTVCSPSSDGFQCRCEDHYRWSCDQCFLHGSCDNITNDTCGCINTIPSGGQYCQSVDQYNFTACPVPTMYPTTTSLPFHHEYLVSIELNTTDMSAINLLRSILRNTSYPIDINNYSKVSDINITTVCSPSSDGFQCRCEDHYRWSCDQCFLHGLCDNITNDTCGCINTIPSGGQYCQSVDQYNFTACPVPTMSPTTTSLPFHHEYLVSIELNTTDMSAINLLRSILRNTSYPIDINNYSKVSDINITTVCSPSSDGFQCRCEDHYRWSCDQCFLHGSCDNITNDTCGCINTIPSGGQYCQSVDQYNFTACPVPTMYPTTTSLPFHHEYLVSIELNTTDMSAINLLRSILRNTSYPIDINNYSKVSDINITTVCSPSSDGFQCRCEDHYRWSCDQCFLHGLCDNITNDTCGCINAIPSGGQYCKSADQHSTTYCPSTTTTFSTTYTTQSTPTTVENTTTTLSTTRTTVTIPPKTTSPPFVYEYLISIELSTTEMSVTTLLRNILRNTSFPIDINNYSNISDINITTVCSPSSNGFQCRCEDHYRWSCDQCLMYGLCDNITNDTCGCINAIPPGGQYCQSADQHNDTFCPSTTTTTFPTMSTTLSTPTTVTNTTTVPTPTTVTNTTTALSTTTPTITNTTTTQTLPTTTRVTINKTTTTTKATTTKTSTTTTSTTLKTTPEITVFKLEMSIKFEKEYTSELSDQTSSGYKNFESQIINVLRGQYGGLAGFINVFVMAFSPGSVIADFVVETSQIDTEKLTKVNQGLPEAMKDIAPVLGPVTARYQSQTEITFPTLTYTGRSMTLTCDPTSDGINLGRITEAKWKLNGREIKDSGRIQIIVTATVSNLIINNVILADAGLYECNMMASALTFLQMGNAAKIRQAPNVKTPGKVNVKCADGETHPLQCCVQSTYTVRWFQGTSTLNSETNNDGESNCILYKYSLSGCRDSSPRELRFTCRVLNEAEEFEETTTMIIFNANVVCSNSLYGNGRPGDNATIACDPGQEGNRTAICRDTGEWSLLEDNCIVTEIKELLIESEDLVEEEVPQFAAELNDVVQNEKQEITNSSATISAIVDILNTIAVVSNKVNETVMKNVLETVDVLVGDDARESWEFLRETRRNDSSRLLNSMEILSDELDGEFAIRTGLILLNTTTFNDSFMSDFNSSVVIDIPNTNSTNLVITTIVFSTLDNVLATRNASFNSTLTDTNSTSASFNDTINAAVALVRVKTEIQNVSLSFKKQNDSLTQNPQCVFWNFTLFDNLGAWDDEGCTLVSDINNTVTCNCDHLTSFSILMATDIPESIRVALDIITYIGVSISLASLVICLIIEGYVWKALTRNSTAFMRHMCIVNTALSLLIADICFIIAAAYAKNPLETPGEDHKVPLGPCTTATFFMHFFYLALFFWMLVSGLLLFYRTAMVFSHMSKSTMMAIGFVLGYVCPLIIAVITVAVTAPGKGYIKEEDACWLNWYKTKALLALVIPALAVVFINILITIVVLFKMLRRGVGDATTTDEKYTLVVIARCVIILTPLFGLTWSLGVGTIISSTNEGIHIAFAFFNSLQGFFILVFGTLLDSKIRAILAKKQPVSSSGSGSNQTASTSGGISSLSGLKWLGKLRGKRYIYHVSEAANSSSSGGSESFSNI
ncbi:uncharacterized protein LOC133467910 isoform X1 [Phyllopteryx taeniolatus]|uniref:uncharacterized protein LOC133467910 isoform X1 n=1 Tax=Phyllopteryx taeniolatus TaxID=161469 RepID=UPI002AD3CDD4|nr:uncharacterized protein LOC133467910 isoform X1 [Phyllopteryx taeniolatus]